MEDFFETLNTESLFGLDIAFVIDSTGSMMSYINGAKESIKEIMHQSQIRFKKFKAEESMLKFGIVAYRDHPPQENTWVTKVQDFSSYVQASEFLDNLNASGGGDPPEAVLDGLNEAVTSLNWRDISEKILFLLLDNPAHGIRFGTNYDCPCKLHEKDILPILKKKQVNFHILRPKEENIKLEKMIDIFKSYLDIEIMELEKHKKVVFNTNTESAMDSELEMRIFNKAKYRSEKKVKEKELEKEKTKYMDIEVNGKESRSRSRSRSKDSRDDRGRHRADREKIHSPIKKSVMNTDSNSIETGVKDIIANTVLMKLDKHYNSLK